MEKKLRVALMGLGNYATIVANAMKQCKHAQIAGLVSGTPAKLTEWRKKYGVPESACYNYDTFPEIANNKDIDAVYILTPNALHHPQTLQTAKAKKHVICEKPMAISSDQAREMIDACKKAGVALLIGYRLHFDKATLHSVGLRKSGELGEIRFFQGLTGFRIGDPNQWRLKRELAGGGSLMDIGIYSVNGARYMVGEEPVWVTAQETKTNPKKFGEGVDETITFQMGFPGGAVASCLSTYNMNHLDRFFLNGSKGFVELHPATGYGPIKGHSHQDSFESPEVPQQAIQMDEMAQIILEGKRPEIPVDGEEGLRDLRIMEAIYSAVHSGERATLG